MSLLPFREMQRQVQGKIQNTNASISGDDDLLPKIKDWLNARYARIYRSFPWEESVDNYNLTLTASTNEYAFNRDIDRIMSIFDKTNGKEVFENTIQDNTREYADSYERNNNEIYDNPQRFRIVGTHTCKSEIGDTPEKVTVVSSNNSTDISPNIAHIEGLVNGVELDEDITLTGTTPAESVNTYDANQKLKISVGTSTGVRKTISGKITVSGSTSSTIFAEIAPSEFAHPYVWFRVSPIPKASGTQPTWEIWYKKYLRRLNNDNDVPVFDCSLELIQGAFADALAEDGLEAEAARAENQFVIMTKELQATRKNPYKIDQFKPVNQEKRPISRDAYGWVI